jgi:hypothetical protein
MLLQSSERTLILLQSLGVSLPEHRTLWGSQSCAFECIQHDILCNVNKDDKDFFTDLH